jgi:hypothetical protein
MSSADYVIDILLILVIFRAGRPQPLTPRAALLPLALLAIAGIVQLQPVTLAGNVLGLIGILAAVGIVLGALSGLADRIWPEQGRLWVSGGRVHDLLRGANPDPMKPATITYTDGRTLPQQARVMKACQNWSQRINQRPGLDLSDQRLGVAAARDWRQRGCRHGRGRRMPVSVRKEEVPLSTTTVGWYPGARVPFAACWRAERLASCWTGPRRLPR